MRVILCEHRLAIEMTKQNIIICFINEQQTECFICEN